MFHLFLDLFAEKSYVQFCGPQMEWRPSWIYANLVSFHQCDFWGFLICFSNNDSELIVEKLKTVAICGGSGCVLS